MEIYLPFVLVIACSLYGLAVTQIPDVEFEIDEELPLQTSVGDISLVPGLFPSLTDQEKQSIQYGILNQASPPASLFNITRNGVLFVLKRIDREELCPVTADCVLTINILASSQNPSEIDSKVVTVYLRIYDINDNAPSFGREQVVLQITEVNSLDSALKISGANDKDFKQEFKVQNYTLDAYQDIFSLSASQTLDGSSEIDLKLLQSLDRETKASYRFTITAYDGGSPPKSAVLNVIVDVTDRNDNPPVFLNDTYSVTVDGEVEINTVIVQVSAVDADQGVNSRISYDFSTIQKSIHVLESTFSINSTSGEISVIGPLKSGLTEFIVEAQDLGSPRLKAQSVVRVYVVNTGNTPPHVTITTLGANSQQNFVSVTEPGDRGLFVAFVVINDDDGDVGDVSCDISHEVFRMEPIPNKGFKIVLQGPVDRETRASYDLTVVCVDRGDPPLNDTANFTVKIEDANDNSPVFTQSRYSRSMKEGQKFNEFVLQVSASDNDIGDNAKIVYSIDSRYREFFSIDPTSGIIVAIGELDREVEPVMTFKVYASDQGKPVSRQTSVDVSVVLEDINDNAPQFSKNIFRLQTREEQDGSRIIEDLKATDKDIGVNGELEFFFTGSLDGADGAFTVMQNGSILSSTRLDREERKNYTFSVMVRDKGNPPRMSSASVVVDVLDINDNAPAILFPKSQNHTILITTVPETGVVLSRIIAYDDDEGDNGSLKYTIVSGNEDRAFQIGDASGEFLIASAPRLKNGRKYNVEILVADRGLPPKFNTTSLKIEVHFDNTTGGHSQSDKENQEDYIIIVAVVAAVTVIFSTLIIVAICVVFQKDRSSRHKSDPKAAFHTLHIAENLSEKEKVNASGQDAKSEHQHQQQQHYSMNNLSSPPGAGPARDGSDGTFFQVQLSFPESQNVPQKGKAVSFSLEDSEMMSSSPRHFSPHEEMPPLTTFGSALRGRSCDDVIYHQRPAMTRQVSGVKYSPVSTFVHADDVISDTSGDTNTSDSGRGNSVDDVNFEQIMKGDLSPRLSSRRRSSDFVLPSRKVVPASTGRSSYHVRFSQNNDTGLPPNLPPKTAHANRFNGGRPLTKQRSDFNGNPESKISNNNLNIPSSLSTFGTTRQTSMVSIDDDATTTTSGSYVISPEEIKMDAFVGSDVIV